ncbi:hypothetical protein ACFE04_021698 [Oxalis oulophora]
MIQNFGGLEYLTHGSRGDYCRAVFSIPVTASTQQSPWLAHQPPWYTCGDVGVLYCVAATTAVEVRERGCGSGVVLMCSDERNDGVVSDGDEDVFQWIGVIVRCSGGCWCVVVADDGDGL